MVEDFPIWPWLLPLPSIAFRPALPLRSFPIRRYPHSNHVNPEFQGIFFYAPLHHPPATLFNPGDGRAVDVRLCRLLGGAYRPLRLYRCSLTRDNVLFGKASRRTPYNQRKRVRLTIPFETPLRDSCTAIPWRESPFRHPSRSLFQATF